MFLRPLLAAIVLLALPEAGATDSMRCGSRIIAVEARAAEILAACGEPSFRDVFSYPGPDLPGEIAEAEQWTYNFGRNQLLHVLRLRNGRLVDISTDGYGFPESDSVRCSPHGITDGLSKYRLLRHCGEPLTRRNIGFVQGFKPRQRQRYGGLSSSRGQYAVEVYREEWVYNFGSRYLLRVVILEDGVVADVQNGERGFNP
ncbi:MAG: DUF2845 domain-containing protein [Panacagrimonas sp.]